MVKKLLKMKKIISLALLFFSGFAFAQRIASNGNPPPGALVAHAPSGVWLFGNVDSTGNLFMNSGLGTGGPVASNVNPPSGAIAGVLPGGGFAYANLDASGNLFVDNSCSGCGGGGLTPTQCLAAAAPVAAPCTAAVGQASGLGAAGTSGAVSLYTSNAPANAVIQICPNIFVTTSGTAGTAALFATWTTPGGASNTAYGLASAALTAFSAATNCATIATAANSTAAFTITTSGATGTPSWEYAYVATRLR